MREIDNKEFGVFLVQLRKEKGLTQKDLADKLYISDKAISKWERGLSLPDIALLMPLAGELGVTTTELLSARRIAAGERLDVEQVEELVNDAIGRTAGEMVQRRTNRRRWVAAYLLCAVAALAEAALLLALGFTLEEMRNNVLLVLGLDLGFGAWFCMGAQETLPAYYDQNKIGCYSDGIFRMNIPGVSFNNSNWPYILRAARIWLLVVPVLFPLIYLAVRTLLPLSFWEIAKPFLLFPATLGMFIPMYVAGKRHQ